MVKTEYSRKFNDAPGLCPISTGEEWYRAVMNVVSVRMLYADECYERGKDGIKRVWGEAAFNVILMMMMDKSTAQ